MCCVAHRQWSWPINLPLPLLGIFGAKTLHNSGPDLPWSDELEHVSLAEKIGIAPYSEVIFCPGTSMLILLELHVIKQKRIGAVQTAFFHKPTRTLLVTDVVQYISEDPPEVCKLLLFFSICMSSHHVWGQVVDHHITLCMFTRDTMHLQNR